MSAWRSVKIVCQTASLVGAVVVVPAAGIRLAACGDAVVPPPPAAAAVPESSPASTGEELVAVLLPPQMADLSTSADARVVAVRAKVGETVRRGDVIVAFDLRARAHDLEIAEAALRVLRADAGVATTDLTVATTRAGRRSGSIDVAGRNYALVSAEEQAQSRAEVESARARAAAASARIAEQGARVEQLRLALRESDLRAPFDGLVSSLTFEPGMTAHAGEVVARVVGGGAGLRVRIAVPETSPALLQLRHARVSWEGQVASATVAHVTAEAEPASRVFVVDADLDAPARVCGPSCYALAGRPVRAVLVP